jgi:integrase/recombinase XerD
MINNFKKYLQNESKSPNTIAGYVNDVSNYFKWLKTSPTTLTRSDVISYRNYCLNKKENAKTVNHKLSALTKYNEYLVHNHHQADIVLAKSDMMKVQNNTMSPTTTTNKDIDKMVSKLNNTKESIRNNTLIILLEYTGLRISEALDLQLDDVDISSGEILVRKGKGSKQRKVFMNTKVISSLKKYLSIRDEFNRNSPYLFVSVKADKMLRNSINRIFNEYSNKITPHKLRHYFCTNAIEKGFNIHEVANMAGHSSIQTTMKYLNANAEKIKNKFEKL